MKKTSQIRLQVYELALEGNNQSSIVNITGKSKSTISYHISNLIEQKALIEFSGQDQVKFYKKGKKSKPLDTLLSKNQFDKQQGGRKPSLLEYPPTTEVHSHGIRYPVIDLPFEFNLIMIRGKPTEFMKQSTGMRGVEQWNGKVTLPDDRVFSVRFQRTKTSQYMYIWTSGEFDKEEIESKAYESTLESDAQDVIRFIAKYSGWHFGLAEHYKGSKTHFVPKSTTVDKVAEVMDDSKGRVYVDGLWVDNSPPREDGHLTPETDDPEVAIGLMTDIVDLAKNHREVNKTLGDLTDKVSDMEADRQILYKALEQIAINQKAIIDTIDTLNGRVANSKQLLNEDEEIDDSSVMFG